eukprot:4451282-Prymnesium_polylepis.1
MNAPRSAAMSCRNDARKTGLQTQRRLHHTPWAMQCGTCAGAKCERRAALTMSARIFISHAVR